MTDISGAMEAAREIDLRLSVRERVNLLTKPEKRALIVARALLSHPQRDGFKCSVDGGKPCPNVCVRQGYCSWLPPKGEETPPIPSPTGTELALAEAKRHIAKLVTFWIDNDRWYGAAEAARAFIAGVPQRDGEGNRGLDAAASLSAEDVQWVTNDIAELGVKIGNQFFFLYKGASLVYENPVHDEGDPDFPEGSPMQWRPVFKREFGECAHPINREDPRYIGTVSLDDSDEWQPLPAPPGADANQQSKTGGTQASDSLARISSSHPAREALELLRRFVALRPSETLGRDFLEECKSCLARSSHPEDGGIREALTGQRLFDAVRKHVRLGDLSLIEWNARTWEDGEWTNTVSGLKEADKEKWHRAAAALNPAPLPIGEEK